MTLPAPIENPSGRTNPSETILLLAQRHEIRAPFREALSGRGFHVLEAANLPHADIMLDLIGASLDLIIGCAESDQEAFQISNWHAGRAGAPLLVVSATDHFKKHLSAEELELRVFLALEAARPTLSVLVVDENDSERSMIANVLETAGYRVTQANNGKQALDVLATETPPNVLLTDIFMAEKDGLELIQEVRKHFAETALVAMAAPESGGYLSIARLLGAKFSLTKPIYVDQLLKVLREACAPGIMDLPDF